MRRRRHTPLPHTQNTAFLHRQQCEDTLSAVPCQSPVLVTVGTIRKSCSKLAVPFRDQAIVNGWGGAPVIGPGALNCIARWKTGYTVTLLSINNLAGYKSVTRQLHGYIVVHQQLSQQQIGNIHGIHSLCPYLDTILGRGGAARRSSPIKNSVKGVLPK